MFTDTEHFFKLFFLENDDFARVAVCEGTLGYQNLQT